MADRVLVVAAHPDDETLGCGATIAKHCAAGDEVAVITMADGVSSRTSMRTDIALRQSACRKACEILGTGDLTMGDRSDNSMDEEALINIVRTVEYHIERIKPAIVYTNWRGDLNVDHQVTHDAVRVATRPQPGCVVRRLLYFEVPCSTTWGGTFQPDHYVDVKDTMSTKLKACLCYEKELRPPPHPRSLAGISNLAAWRGAMIGVDAAEAFKVGRWIA